MQATIIKSSTPEDTTHLASQLSALLRPGDVLILTGDLAAGKTHFVKSLVEAFGSTASVSSPTYTIAHHYPTDKMPVLHIDAYRLSGADEFRDLTLDDYYDKSLICVEWGDVIAGVFAEYLRLDFNFTDEGDTAREIQMIAVGARWADEHDKIEQAVMQVNS